MALTLVRAKHVSLLGMFVAYVKTNFVELAWVTLLKKFWIKKWRCLAVIEYLLEN